MKNENTSVLPLAAAVGAAWMAGQIGGIAWTLFGGFLGFLVGWWASRT